MFETQDKAKFWIKKRGCLKNLIWRFRNIFFIMY